MLIESQSKKIPVVWTIGASDASGGSGIQADLHTFHDYAVHGCTVITALNAQNSFALGDVAVTSAQSLRAQISALENDMPAKAIKLGVIPNAELAQIVGEYLQEYKGLVIYDLELASSASLLLEDTEKLFDKVLLPRSDIVVANTEEVKTLTGIDLAKIDSKSENLMLTAAQYFLEKGVGSILITGATIPDIAEDTMSSRRVDYWSDGEDSFWIEIEAIKTANNQAGGCTLSASITALISRGELPKDAITQAKAYVTRGIKGAQQIGNGPGAVAHLGLSDSDEDMPTISKYFPK